jgi:acyl-CoA hydrolase
MAKKRRVAPSLTTAGNLMIVARKLASKQRRRRELLKMLRIVDAEIKQAKKELKALAGQMTKDDPFDQTPPMRVFNET